MFRKDNRSEDNKMEKRNSNNLRKFRFSKLALLASLVTAAVWAKPEGKEVRPNQQFVPNEVLVQFKPNVNSYSAQASGMSKGAANFRLLKHTPQGTGPTAVVKSLSNKSVEEMIADFSADPNVEFAQPNYIYHATATTPNDTNYGQLWGLKNSNQTISSPSYATSNPPGVASVGKDIGAESAWDVITDCSSTVVAVIDSGVNYNHEDITSNMVNGSYTCPVGTGSRGCDFVGTGDADPKDENGHGTHVAMTIGAVGNNGTGVTGVCWKAKILAVRVLDAGGSGTTADIIEGLNFAVGTSAGQGQAKIVNMSLGGSGGSLGDAFDLALDTARTNDVVVVIAAGNDGVNHTSSGKYPCDYPDDNIICVAAMDQAYNKATFSDFDSNSTVASRKVDIGAPGVNIRSGWAGEEIVYTTDFSTWTTASSGGTTWATANNCPATGYQSLYLSSSCSAAWAGTASNGYAAFTDSRAYKSFSINTGLESVRLDYIFTLDLEAGYDFLYGSYANSATDPFTGGTNMLGSAYYSSQENGTAYNNSHSLPNCQNSGSCTVGFRVTSDDIFQYAGVAFTYMRLTTMDLDVNNAYNVINGTSMASPHVAGIATMLRARNPNFTYTDVVTAITTRGDVTSSISGTTKFGTVADARKSLEYIPQTSGVSANP